MNSSTAQPNDDPDLARWGLVSLALVIGAFVMVCGAQLLQEPLQDPLTNAAQPRDVQQTAELPIVAVRLASDTR